MPPAAPYDRQTFLLQLGDRIRDLADADAIVETTVDALGVHLGASRVVYAEIDADGHTARVVADWSDGSLPSLVGEHTLDPFGDALARQWRAGRAARIDDVANDHRVEISAGLQIPGSRDTSTAHSFSIDRNSSSRNGTSGQ